MHADVTRLRQCLLNLLSNACKFTKGGTVSLTVTREKQAGHDCCDFAVSDTGIGMTAEQFAGCSRPSARPTPRPRASTAARVWAWPSPRFCPDDGRRRDLSQRSRPGLGFHSSAARTAIAINRRMILTFTVERFCTGRMPIPPETFTGKIEAVAAGFSGCELNLPA